MKAASEHSYRLRKMVYGVGINDSDFMSERGMSKPKSYQDWTSMLARGHSPAVKARMPWYSDVEVCKEWHLFSAFYEWWKGNSVDGWDLDKDLLIPGNRIYSPGGCIYIPRWLNVFTAGCKSRRSLPVGCSWHKASQKYRASISISDKAYNLGLFTDPRDAHKAWKDRKIELVNGFRDEIDRIDPRIYRGVMYKIESAADGFFQ